MKISVITINYNNKDGLERTIKSVIRQTYPDYEYIIIDGGSTDGGKDVFDEYRKRYNIKGVSEPDKGLYNAMNKGIDFATSDYCIFMNSGDEFYDDKSLENIAPYLDGQIGVVAGIAQMGKMIWYPPSNEKLNLTFFLKDSFCHQSVFVRRDILVKHHFSESNKIVSDTEFLFKAIVLDNESYKDAPKYVCLCERPGISGNLGYSLQERYLAIKKLIPPRMSYDVDFIVKYHNPIILWIGNTLYNKFFRKIFQLLKNKKVHK